MKTGAIYERRNCKLKLADTAGLILFFADKSNCICQKANTRLFSFKKNSELNPLSRVMPRILNDLMCLVAEFLLL